MKSPYDKGLERKVLMIMAPRDRADSLSDIVLADRLARLEVVIENLKKDLDDHILAQNGLFYRYGWPLVQVLIWIAIVLVFGKGVL